MFEAKSTRILLVFFLLTCVLAPATRAYIDVLQEEQYDVILRQNINFRIDSSFSSEEIKEIFQAFVNWNEASGNLVYLSGEVVDIPDWEERIYRHDDSSTIYDAVESLNWPATILKRYQPSFYGLTIGAIGDIFIFNKDRKYFRILIEHEIGHVLMGSYHSKKPTDLMFPYLSELVKGITPNDVRVLRNMLAQ